MTMSLYTDYYSLMAAISNQQSLKNPSNYDILFSGSTERFLSVLIALFLVSGEPMLAKFTTTEMPPAAAIADLLSTFKPPFASAVPFHNTRERRKSLGALARTHLFLTIE